MSKRNLTPQQLEDRLIDFASRIIGLSESLPKTPAALHIGKQLFRSGSSPALNYGEAQSAESKADFVHKMKICIKELRETLICLKIILKRNWIAANLLQDLVQENNELISIFVASIKTLQNK